MNNEMTKKLRDYLNQQEMTIMVFDLNTGEICSSNNVRSLKPFVEKVAHTTTIDNIRIMAKNDEKRVVEYLISYFEKCQDFVYA